VNTALRLGVNTLFYLPGEVGGSETYLLETLRALLRRSDKPDGVLFSNAENDGKLRREFPDVEVVATGVKATNRFARILAEQIQLPRLVKRARVDVLWSPGCTAPFRCVCPQVVTMHDMQYKHFPADVSWLAARTMDALYPGIARRCAALVVPSEFARREIVGFAGVDSARVFVTGEGVDPAFGAPSGPPPAEVRTAPFLLCVAHTHPHKNVALLVRVFNRLAAQIPHRLVLVGQARRGEAEVAAALANSPPGRVLRFSRLPRPVLIALYQFADWFVFPSLYEGFGLPVLEAMCAGAPVLATREAAIPEVGGEAVRYADGRDETGFAAALRMAVNLPREERARLVEAGQKRAADFTWEASAGKLWYVWMQVLKNEVKT
jgi:glycosyltransferase involved in cell wall biosynthesis